MKVLIHRLALALGLVLGLALAAEAHGGQYTGPSGGGSTGGFAPVGVGTPGPGPGPAGGGTGGGGSTAPVGTGVTTPGVPGSSQPGSGGGQPGTGGTGTGVPISGTTGAKPKGKSDPLNNWDAWWFFNDDRYLNLKAKLRADENETTNMDLIGGSTVGFGDEVSRVNARLIREEINPVLKYALKDSFYDTRAAALIALGKTGMPEALDDIRSLMADESMQVRESSFLAMGILGNREAIPTLIEVMNDSALGRKLIGNAKEVETRTRAFAALGIGLIGARERDLGDTSARQALEAMLADRDNERQVDLQAAPITALGIMKDRESVPVLTAFLRDRRRPAMLRAQAATALAKIGDVSARGALVEGLEDKDNAVVQSCAQGLGLIARPDDKEIVDRLQKLLRSAPDVGAKNFAIMALAQIGGEDNRNLLCRLIGGGNTTERAFAALALGVYLHQHPADGARSEVAALLHKQFKNEKNPDFRGACAIALGLAGHDAAGPDLLEILQKAGQPALRGHVCIGLGLMRHEAAIKEIRRTVADRGDVDLRRNAAVALGLMGDGEAVRVLQREIEASENSMAVQGAVTQGLGFIGDRSAVPTLVRFLRERDRYQDVTRAFAAVALGLLGDKDDLPILSLIAENSNYLSRSNALVEVMTIL
ncbi:MAG: HEAT repeat domain-containing protein [Planctomycetes bacterium]|nr:HEAT repeat domain-containing protein [Planctomycetota bacterium]